MELSQKLRNLVPEFEIFTGVFIQGSLEVLGREARRTYHLSGKFELQVCLEDLEGYVASFRFCKRWSEETVELVTDEIRILRFKSLGGTEKRKCGV